MIMPVRTSALDDQMGSMFARMPPESLNLVTRHLTTPEFGALRLSCKLMERRLFGGFATEFFSKKQYMFTRFSLQTLIDVSNNADISPYVWEVQLGTERYPNPASSSYPHGLIPLMRAIDAEQFIQRCEDEKMLAVAFANLSNLQKVTIRDSPSRTRSRDYDPSNPRNTGTWWSYGFVTVDKGVINDSNNRCESCPRYISHMWNALLHALDLAAQSNPDRPRPKHIELLLRRQDSLLLDVDLLVPSSYMPQRAPVLHALEVLHLTISFHRSSQTEHSLTSLLSLVPNLRHLRINVKTSSSRFRSLLDQGPWISEIKVRAFLKWMSLSGDESDSNVAARFPYLERLDLGDLDHVDPHDLISCFEKLHPTLTSLCLRRIHLGLSDNRNKLSGWLSVLRFLATKMPKLRTLYLEGLAQLSSPVLPNGVANAIPIVFVPGQVPVRSYTGQSMTEFCEIAMKEIKILPSISRPIHQDWDDNVHSDTEDENEDDDDNDDDQEAEEEEGAGVPHGH